MKIREIINDLGPLGLFLFPLLLVWLRYGSTSSFDVLENGDDIVIHFDIMAFKKERGKMLEL